jgi:hypothetical protein
VAHTGIKKFLFRQIRKKVETGGIRKRGGVASFQDFAAEKFIGWPVQQNVRSLCKY